MDHISGYPRYATSTLFVQPFTSGAVGDAISGCTIRGLFAEFGSHSGPNAQIVQSTKLLAG